MYEEAGFSYAIIDPYMALSCIKSGYNFINKNANVSFKP